MAELSLDYPEHSNIIKKIHKVAGWGEKEVNKRTIVKTAMQGVKRVELHAFLTDNKPIIDVISKTASVSCAELSV